MKTKKSNPLLLTLLLLLASLVPLFFIFQLNDPRISYFIPDIIKKRLGRSVSPSNVTSPFDNPANKILFAKNGDTEIYKVQEGDQWAVLIGDQKSALYDAVDNPTFSPDGTRFAYSATLDNQEFVVVDNTPQENRYLNIKQILFSPDGKILAYLAENSDGSLVIINGVEGKTYQDIGTLETEAGVTFLSFTPDSQNIVYRAEEGQKTFVIVNTAEGKRYAEITTIYFSSDGSQIAYYAEDGNQLYTIINNQVTNVQPINPTPPNTNPPPPSTPPQANTTPNSAKSKSRNLSPGIDNQPDKLNPLICGQTTDCNF
ncbi:hypothetical protein EPO05_01075 [Patescibacteria group bacterium]|nr:MAG: hypothetical protein EPO05_01075 [Patescibacteria group bacterium]